MHSEVLLDMLTSNKEAMLQVFVTSDTSDFGCCPFNDNHSYQPLVFGRALLPLSKVSQLL